MAAGLENGSRASSSSSTSSHLSGSQIKHDPHGSQLGTENLRNSLKPETWRSWIIQRTGFPDTDFEGNVVYVLRFSYYCSQDQLISSEL